MRIAIIGSGFFGLAIAIELSKYKNIVDIFEIALKTILDIDAFNLVLIGDIYTEEIIDA